MNVPKQLPPNPVRPHLKAAAVVDKHSGHHSVAATIRNAMVIICLPSND